MAENWAQFFFGKRCPRNHLLFQGQHDSISVMHQLDCPTCRRQIVLPSARVGALIDCPNCLTRIETIAAPPRSSAIITAEPRWRQKPEPTRLELAAPGVYALALFASVGVLGFGLDHPNGLYGIVGAGCSAGSVAWLVMSKFGIPYRRSVVLASVLIAASAFIRLGSYSRRFEVDDIHYIVSVSRWTGLPYYERNHSDDHWSEGALTESGKRHGEWRFTFFPTAQTIHSWHWYGEEVSEGEFHRRHH